jgi:hypothetical protein
MTNPMKWEYQDFVYPLPPGRIWANCGRVDHPDILAEIFMRPGSERPKRSRSFDEAKELFWREYREEIYTAIQKWIDAGWEPGDEVNASGITLHTYKSFKTYPTLRPLLIVLSVFMIGLPLFWRDTVAEPTEYRLLMRRPNKQHPGP